MNSKMGLTADLGVSDFPSEIDFTLINADSPLLTHTSDGPEMRGQGRMSSELVADGLNLDNSRPAKRGRR